MEKSPTWKKAPLGIRPHLEKSPTWKKPHLEKSPTWKKPHLEKSPTWKKAPFGKSLTWKKAPLGIRPHLEKKAPRGQQEEPILKSPIRLDRGLRGGIPASSALEANASPLDHQPCHGSGSRSASSTHSCHAGQTHEVSYASS